MATVITQNCSVVPPFSPRKLAPCSEFSWSCQEAPLHIKEDRDVVMAAVSVSGAWGVGLDHLSWVC